MEPHPIFAPGCPLSAVRLSLREEKQTATDDTMTSYRAEYESARRSSRASMAHALFQDTMAYVGETPWHGLGKKVLRQTSAEDMIRAANLDWVMFTQPASGAVQDAKGLWSRRRLMREPVGPEREPVEFGLVGKRYVVVQNRDAFKFFDPLLDTGVATLESAGALHQGQVVWIQARVTKAYEIEVGDEVRPFVLLSTRHDGEGAVTVRFSLTRVVCQNTLNVATKEAKAAYSIPHTGRPAERLRDAGVKVLTKLIDETMDRATRIFDSMRQHSMDSDTIRQFMESIYEPPKPRDGAATTTRRVSIWDRVEERVKAQASGADSAGGETLWGLYNAITFIEDDMAREAGRDGGDMSIALDRIWFGTAAERKLKAFNAAAKLVGETHAGA
jgi:phage/plasmid-like protein (TIGR03299 family)